ncbi:MAG: N-6 DNA methylase, partial [bacterium]|nr:N-6 DNA methylase [bacterium]
MYNATKEEHIIKSVNGFSSYVDEIEMLLHSLSKKPLEKWDIHISSILNGRTSNALQSLVPQSIRKEAGIFFTNTELADKVASRISGLLNKGKNVIDPACGAGNLLTSCAKLLPTGNSLNETLSIWSDLISGYDIHEQFIRAAKLRLILLAAHMHNDSNESTTLIKDEIFKGIQRCDTLSLDNPTRQADAVVVNPPFGHVIAPLNCTWASGKIQFAALFIEKLLISASEGLQIVAILPDVLRSGSRYLKWRKMVSVNSDYIDIELAGKFDDKTDVDVFVLHVIKGKSNRQYLDWHMMNMEAGCKQTVIGDFFDVRIGPVVPYRDSHEGNCYPYVDCSSATPWTIVEDLPVRRYKGTVFDPPFVVIRRTSNPADKSRSISVIITG